MPKRICAIVLTPDDSALLVGDKFGDVYLLPLQLVPHELTVPSATSTESKTADFKPSANELTVHTKGNLEALRQQRMQKAAVSRKEGPSFEHKLLLGHVSLLTDLRITETIVENHRRQYILTADRDEHIRVSRGPSQAYIIENYCLGHGEFVSKLCVLPWQQDVLVAGSGEPSIKTFHWPTGKLLDEYSILQLVKGALPSVPLDGREKLSQKKLATSGLWPMRVGSRTEERHRRSSQGFVLAAIEG